MKAYLFLKKQLLTGIYSLKEGVICKLALQIKSKTVKKKKLIKFYY